MVDFNNLFEYKGYNVYGMEEEDWMINDVVSDSKYFLDDNVNYGEDYPDSYVDYDLYRILKSIQENPNLDEVLSDIKLEGLLSDSMIKKILFDKDFIKAVNSQVKVNIKDELQKMNASELKNLLKKYGINASGKKKKLIKLAVNSIPDSEFQKGSFEITAEGEDYLNKFQWVDFYDSSLYFFDFNEYYRYLEEHDGNYIQLGLDFNMEHFNSASKKEDVTYMDKCFISRALICIYADDVASALDYELERFIFRLNPPYLSYSLLYSCEDVFIQNNINSIKMHVDDLNVSDLRDLFNNIWVQCEFKKGYIEEDEAFRYLERAFDEDLAELSSEFFGKFFNTSEENYNMGQYYFDLDDYSEAFEYFELSFNMNSDNIEALYYMGLCYCDMNKVKEAIKIADKGLKLYDDPKFYTLKAFTYEMQDDHDNALKYHKLAIDCQSDNFELWRNLGVFYVSCRDLKEACNCFKKSAELNPDDLDSRLYIARSYIGLNEFKKAKNSLDEINKDLGPSVEYYREYVGYYVALNDYEKAIEYCDKGLEFDKSHVEMLVYKSLAYFSLNDSDSAQQYLNQAYDIDMDRARYLLATIFENSF